jgi:periplasmic divalent cation tolerance protein
MTVELLLAISTFPDAESAAAIASQLVDERLAACANIMPGVRSIYRWEGKIEDASETTVFFKTTAERRAAFQERLKSLHPYDVPEIIFLPVKDGLPAYLDWVAQSCAASA